jgi:hypothetical protein
VDFHGLSAVLVDWARRPGASLPMRMAASWSRSERIHRIQGCDAISASNSELASGSSVNRFVYHQARVPFPEPGAVLAAVKSG